MKLALIANNYLNLTNDDADVSLNYSNARVFVEDCTFNNHKGIVDGVVSYADDSTCNYYQGGVSFIFANNTFRDISDGSNAVFYSDGIDLDDYVLCSIFCIIIKYIY